MDASTATGWMAGITVVNRAACSESGGHLPGACWDEKCRASLLCNTYDEFVEERGPYLGETSSFSFAEFFPPCLMNLFTVVGCGFNFTYYFCREGVLAWSPDKVPRFMAQSIMCAFSEHPPFFRSAFP